MPYSHDHHHDPHNHDHHHGSSCTQAPLSFPEKLSRLLDHWIQHNDHHAGDYRKWAQEARDHDQTAAADLLESAAELTDAISDRFRQAGESVQPE
jgi:hypothetical protein